MTEYCIPLERDRSYAHDVDNSRPYSEFELPSCRICRDGTPALGRPDFVTVPLDANSTGARIGVRQANSHMLMGCEIQVLLAARMPDASFNLDDARVDQSLRWKAPWVGGQLLGT